jgi:PDZ domain-containing secreted protein
MSFTNQYYCGEFLINGLNMLYQFKIWNIATDNAMFTLVKEDSDIINNLKVGDVVDMKYYSTNSLYPTENFNTEIKFINKDDRGRFKGHYRIGLAIVGQTLSPVPSNN